MNLLLDEGLHTKFACMLYNNYISNKIDESIVHDMFNEAVEIETNFITKSLPCKLIGMNSDKMTNYIKYVADLLLVSLKYNKLYNVNECPFDFMNAISLEGKVNFLKIVQHNIKKQYLTMILTMMMIFNN